MTTLGPNAGNAHITVKPSLRGWSADVRRQLRQELKDLPPLQLPAPKDSESEKSGTRAGDKFAGGFDRAVRKRISSALDALPETQVGVATNEAEQRIKDLRAELATLSGQRIGIDVDARAAVTRLHEIQGELTSLAAQSPTINVQADTLRAAAELSAIHREVNALDGDDVNIKVDVDRSATSALAALEGAAGGFLSKVQLLTLLGTALLPIGAVLAGLGATLTATLVAAGGGIGILLASVLGNILPVIKAQSELKQKQQEAASTAAAYASAQNQVKTSVAGLESAEISASRAIADAQRAVADARRNAGRSIQSAEDAVTSAEQRGRDALEALSTAREAARTKLAAYAAQLRGAAIDEAGAAISVTAAQEALNAVMSDPTATQLQIDQARQALTEAKFSYDESTKRRKDLKKQAAEDRRNGVAGDQSVIDAKERLAQANADIATAEKRLGQARADAARSVADAERNLARARADGARAVAAAEAQVAQAQAAEAEAARKNADAQAEVAKRMAQLKGPAAVFVAALAAAKRAWHDFTKETAGDSFGLAAQGLGLFTRLLPQLAPLVKIAARAVGTLLRDFGRFTKGEGQGFLTWMQDHARRAIVTMGRSIGNLIVGMGGLVGSLSRMDGGFLRMTRRFADFGRNAGQNSTVQRFFAYTKRMGPIVAAAFAAIGAAIVNLVTAAAPIGTMVLKAITLIARGISMVDPTIIQALVAGFLAFRLVTIAAAVAVAILNLVLDANPIVLIGLAIAALVIGLILAYKKVDWFRKSVDAAWAGIKDATMFLWKRVIVPAFRAIATAIQFYWSHVIKPVLRLWWAYITHVLIPVIRFLWTKIVKPVFGFIGSFIAGVWKRVIRPILQAWWFQIEHVVIPAIRRLWEKVVKPVFGCIGDKISNTWTRYIKPVFVALRDFLKDEVAPKIRTAVDVIAKLWNKLATAAFKPIQFVVGTIYNDGLRKVINAVPGVTDVDPITVPSPPKFADGGPVRGGIRGKDSVLSLLMPEEHVLTAEEVRKAGGHGAITRLRALIRAGRLNELGDLPAFASGGALSALQISAGQNFARNQVGKPYLWGGVGPNGFDCSGFMSAITNILRGAVNPYSRLGSTATFPWSGFAPGPGQFTIGAATPYPGSTVGHMAGTLDGLNVESRGGEGVVVGPSARGYNDPGFQIIGHLGAGGGAAPGTVGAGGGGGVQDALKALATFATAIPGQLKTLGAMQPWGGLLRGGVSELVDHFEGWVADKLHIKNPLSALGGAAHAVGGALSGALSHVFDTGGVARGVGYLPKATLLPERVLSPAQTAAFERQVATLDNWDRTARMLAGTRTPGVGPARLEVAKFRIVDWDKGLAELEYMATSAAEQVLSAHDGHDARIHDLDVSY